MVNTVEILKGARALLETGCWGKGEYVTQTEGGELFCSLGALYQVAGTPRNARHGFDTAERTLALREAETLLQEALQDAPKAERFDDVPDFNDRESTTLEDVLELFDWAINTAQECAAAPTVSL